MLLCIDVMLAKIRFMTLGPLFWITIFLLLETVAGRGAPDAFWLDGLRLEIKSLAHNIAQYLFHQVYRIAKTTKTTRLLNFVLNTKLCKKY